jgi:ATP-binding cassette subfamily F protein uup
LADREHNLMVEQRQQALFDKKLAQEERWIRQGIKARRTRNEGRVRALQQLRKQRAARREQQASAKIAIDSGSLSGKLVAQLEDISYRIDDRVLFEHVNCTVLRGDKVGLIGPNGVGKTTLLRIILGELTPTSGTTKLGTRLRVAYFDQTRAQLDDEQTVIDIVGQGRERIDINGQSRHIIAYLGDFLFTPQRARTPIKVLSGGERSRVQLALLFSQPANILVLDEPTNDLDIETLELLESILVDFSGTVLLVSHDRAFMDNVATCTLAFEGRGIVREYIGGYTDWLRQGGAYHEQPIMKKPVKQKPATKKVAKSAERELRKLESQIERLEQQKCQLEEEIGSAEFYQQQQSIIDQRLQALAKLNEQLDSYYQQWEVLEDAI